MEELVAARSRNFWYGRRVLVTGHTGFKGSWLSLWLMRLGAEVTGIALQPNTNPSLFELARVADDIDSHFCDIRNGPRLSRIIHATRPEVIFHLAAQPLVRASYRDPEQTFATNVMGTVHLLEALRGQVTPRVAIMVTTDKVYRNREWIYPYREDDELGGHDPYSASKAASELVIASYRMSYLKAQGVALASARAGNVIGGGDWSKDRLIPDAVRAWQSETALTIRRPQATRPWQHVLEPLSGYMALAERLHRQPEIAGSFNFGPPSNEAVTVREVVEQARGAFGCGDVIYDQTELGPHEAGWLALETAKVRQTLGIAPRWTLPQSISRTMGWYQAVHRGGDARQWCMSDMDAYGMNP